MVYAAQEDRYEKMPYRRVSDSGLILPDLSLGFWRNMGDQRPLADSKSVILEAFDNGIFSFDHASNYGPSNGTAEDTFGAVYKSDLKPYRNELVITTKAGYHMWPGPYGEFSSKKTLTNALDLSLQRMHLDYVDIFYAHRWDPETNLRETAEALDLLVRQGKALYIGVSNYTAEQTAAIAEIFEELHTPFIGNQMSYNMLNREAEKANMLDILDEHHAGLIAYGPLAEGLLTDRYLDGIPADMPLHRSNAFIAENPEKAVKQLNELNELAKNRNQSLAQMAMAWLLKDPRVGSLVFGATSSKHLQANIAAMQNLSFTADELTAIDNILK